MSAGNNNGNPAVPRWDPVPRFSVSGDRDDTPPSSGNTGSVLGPPAENPERVVKRMRTRRACDGCRSRKIRCQYPNGREAVGSCAHCELHGLACVATKPTKVAPVIYSAPSSEHNDAEGSEANRGRASSVETVQDYRDLSGPTKRRWQSPDIPVDQGLEARFYGGTSIPSLIASVSLPSASLLPASSSSHPTGERRSSVTYDMDQLHFNSVYSGERFVLVTADDESSLDPHDTSSSRRPANLAAKHSSTEERIASQLVSESVLENLINLYRMRIIPVNPVVSISETVGLFPWIRKPHLDSVPPTPLPRLLRLIVCSVPAQWRAVPKEIRESLHVTLQSQMDGGGGSALMRTSSLGNVQTLLVLAISLEVLRTRRESWLTVGLAIRMAQEIGLHREMPDYAVPVGQRNRRKRVWAACQITDAWYALTSGLPLTINPGDCDVGPPSLYPDHASSDQADDDRCFETHVHLWQLGLILGRTIRAVCDSGGLAFTSDAVLYQIERDLVDREMEFPSEEELPAFGEFDRGNTNILKLVSVCIEGILHRAFLQPARPIPPHITFRPSTARWIRLVRRSAEAIQWLSKKEGIFYLDVWHIVAYSLVVCTIIQTHDYLMSGNDSSRESLQLANKVVQSWAKSSDGEHPRKRAKIASQLGALISAVVASRPHNTEKARPSTSSSSSGLSVSPTATVLFPSQPQLGPEQFVLQQQQQPQAQQRQQHQQQQQQQPQQQEPSDVNFRAFSFDSEMGPLVEGSIWDLLNSDAPSVFPTEHTA